MKMIFCPRCKEHKPRYSSRHNKVWGGSICAECSKEIFQLLRRNAPPFFRTPGRNREQPIARAPQKLGLINRMVNRLFRRRGVQ